MNFFWSIQKKKILTGVFITLLLGYLPIFHNFSKHTIFIWDESLYASNAIDMVKNGSVLVLKEGNTATFNNVKPPLVIWLQVLSIKTFGANEFAIRLPSAIATFLVCFLVFYFTNKNFGFIAALLSVLILLSSPGYIRNHVTRTGDLDSVLVLFTTGYSLLFFDFVLNKSRHIVCLFSKLTILTFLAFLSKGVAGLLPLPGIIISVLFFKDIRKLLLTRLGVTFFLLTLNLCFGYYFIRELVQPGYFHRVWQSEFLRFTSNIMPWHNHSFYFYFKNLAQAHFNYFLWTLPLLFVKSTHPKIPLFGTTGFIYILTFLLFISCPLVKLDWYDAPLYPVLAIMAATGIQNLLIAICKPKQIYYSIVTIIGLAILIIPYKKNIQQINSTPTHVLEKNGEALSSLPVDFFTNKAVKILMTVEHTEHFDQAKFYVKVLKYSNNIDVKIINTPTQVNIGDYIIVEQPEDRKTLLQMFKANEVKHGNIRLCYITSKG